jgi:hypothetical protein
MMQGTTRVLARYYQGTTWVPACHCEGTGGVFYFWTSYSPKLALVARVSQATTLPIRWIAVQLPMGSPKSLRPVLYWNRLGYRGGSYSIANGYVLHIMGILPWCFSAEIVRQPIAFQHVALGYAKLLLRCVSGEYPASIGRVSLVSPLRRLPQASVNRNRFVSGLRAKAVK